MCFDRSLGVDRTLLTREGKEPFTRKYINIKTELPIVEDWLCDPCMYHHLYQTLGKTVRI